MLTYLSIVNPVCTGPTVSDDLSCSPPMRFRKPLPLSLKKALFRSSELVPSAPLIDPLPFPLALFRPSELVRVCC